MKTLIVTQLVSATVVISALAVTGCGKKDEPAAANLSAVSLSDLPSSSAMLKSSSASSASVNSRLEQQMLVSGTAPLLSQLKAGAVTYFFGGSLPGGGASAAQKNAFWGNTDGGPGGMGACRMAQGVGESFGRMLEAGGSACYMKNIPKATSGVTITGATAGDLFTQAAADKLVKVAAHQPGGDMNVFIKVFGSNTVTSDVYKASLYFCTNNTVTGAESFEINKATGAYTATSKHTDSGKGSMTVTATLKNEGGKIVFDLGQNRQAQAQFEGSWGNFKSDLTITGDDHIYAKNYNSSSWGTGKNYSILKFSGSGLSTLRFLEGAFQDSYNDGNGHTGSNSQGVEWQDSVYKAVASSSLKTQAAALNMASDSFFASYSSLSIDLSSYDCSATATASLTMDFTDPGVASIKQTCEGDRFTDYDLCYSAALQTAMGNAY